MCVCNCADVSIIENLINALPKIHTYCHCLTRSRTKCQIGVTDLRRFLGIASYYRRYIKGFASIATPLHQLTNKGVPFIWSESCQIAFNQLKQSLLTPPILVVSYYVQMEAVLQ